MRLRHNRQDMDSVTRTPLLREMSQLLKAVLSIFDMRFIPLLAYAKPLNILLTETNVPMNKN